tara:strand:- start:505 stop:996 length:492 start_codon:yes stop_codon:yes gene_type:complete
MLLGVVSDTHNNIRNVNNAISIFNKENVDVVIHTGDICKPQTLKLFSKLNCPLIGVFGNNDRIETGLEEICKEFSFNFSSPPFLISLHKKKIAIFHEPDPINEYLKLNKDINLVLHGHTHRYREEMIEDTICFNPGESAGLIQGKNALGIINLNNLAITRLFF